MTNVTFGPMDRGHDGEGGEMEVRMGDRNIGWIYSEVADTGTTSPAWRVVYYTAEVEGPDDVTYTLGEPVRSSRPGTGHWRKVQDPRTALASVMAQILDLWT